MSSVTDIQRAQRKEWRDEWPFEPEFVPISYLVRDGRYQRDVIEGFVDAKVAAFDPRLVGTVDLSKRGRNEFAVLDGLQRWHICQGVEKRLIPANVYEDMTLAQEAEHFKAKNRERRNMHPFYILRASRVAGDADAREIFSVVGSTGFKLASNNTKRKGDVIVAIGAVEQVHATRTFVRPDSPLGHVLESVRDSFGDRPMATEGTVLRGLGKFWAAYYDDEVNYDHLVNELAEIGPAKLKGYAEDRVRTSRMSKGDLVATEIVKAYNRKMRGGKKLSLTLLERPRTA